MSNYNLAIIIPVYNESEIISKVIDQCSTILTELDIKFQIHVYNDGSKDNTGNILDKLVDNRPFLKIHHKKNTGHGPTILQGYRDNCDAEWLFQMDSDNEISFEHFKLFWAQKNNYDFIIGKRIKYNHLIIRWIISFITRKTIHVFYGKGITDINCPFRLFKSSSFNKLIHNIPSDTFAPNVILSGYAILHKKYIKEIEVLHTFRETGEVSLKKWNLIKSSFLSFVQTITFRFSNHNI